MTRRTADRLSEDEVRALKRRLRERQAHLVELEAQVRTLEKIKVHREWVISGLREHIANIESLLEGLEEHVDNVEELRDRAQHRVAGLEEHSANLERRLEEREAYLAEVEAHVIDLARRLRKPGVRLNARGIFPESSRPRLRALFSAAERIWAEREDLQVRFPTDQPSEYWFWLLWHGPRSHEEIPEHLYPQPEEYLRGRVVGEEAAQRSYYRSGLVNWWTIEGCLREANLDFARGAEILDFGVGCGRILQFFALYSESCRFWGADVDKEAIDWCAQNLDFGHFLKLPQRPPSSFQDEMFDAVYAFSVFSHLPEDLHLAWLEELARISKPGAVLVLTTQGRRVVDEILAGRQRESFPTRRQLEKHLEALNRGHFQFFPYRHLRFEDPRNASCFATWDLSEYGSTFTLEPYIERKWTQWFEVDAFHEAPDDWQDYVVLRRK